MSTPSWVYYAIVLMFLLVEKVMAVKGRSDFYLYRIAGRKWKAYEIRVREWLEKKANEKNN